MFCTSCGKKVEEGVKFCSNCGNEVNGPKEEPIDQIEEDAPAIAIEAEVKEKKKTSKLAIIALSLAVVLIGILVAKDSILYAMSPKAYVAAAMNKTSKVISKDIKKMEDLVWVSTSPNKSSTNTMKLVVDRVDHTDPWASMGLNMLSGMGIEMATSIDTNNKELQISGRTFYNSRDLLSINAKLDNNELLFNIPELYHKAFTVPSKEFGREWNNSSMANESYNYVEDSLDISYSELFENMRLEKMDDRTKKQYLKVIQTLIKNAKFQKDGSEGIYIGDKERKCDRTSVILDERDLKNALLELIDAIKNDNRMEQVKDSLRKTNEEEALRELEDALNEIRYGINENFEADEILMDIYTYKGSLVKMDLTIMPDRGYREDSMKISIGFFGDKSPIDDFRFEFLMGEFEDGKIVFSSKGNHTGVKNQFTDDTSLVVYDYGQEMMRLSAKTEIDLSAKTDNLRYDLNLSSDEINIRMDARGDFLSTSKKMEYNLKDIQLSASDYYGDTFTFEGSLELTQEEGARKISDIGDIEKVQLLRMSLYDIYDIVQTMQSKVYNIMNIFNF